jgi:GAF domain-containing protein
MASSQAPSPDDDLIAVLTDTFVTVADTLVADFDVSEMLHFVVDRSVELVGVRASGLLLMAADGPPQVAAASSEDTLFLEVLQVQDGDGPCVECVRTGAAVVATGAQELARWPHFARAAAAAGYDAVYSLPLRLRSRTLGSLNLFDTGAPRRTESELRIGQALADVAAISLAQQRALERNVVLGEQLEHALQSRVVIEQAKGVVAEAARLDMTAAFALLLKHARNHNLRLGDVARRVVEGTLPASDLAR